MRSLKSWVWCALFILACGVGALHAQNGVIQGTLLDPQGGLIGNAKVSATDEVKTIVVRETVTGTDGVFQLRPLPPGRYTIKASSPGMKPIERTGLVLDVNQITNLGDIQMEVGSTTDTVTVVAETPQVETSTANKGFLITSQQVTEQSLNGRDFQSLLRTLPGVVSNDSSDFRLAFNNTDSFNVNGMRGSMNNVFLDGSINTDVGANDGQYTQLSMDAVGEFKVQTSVFNAEYGRNPGVLIAATTKSGSSSFHGTAYEFLRNDKLDANNFFNNLQGRNKSPLRFNQFGGNIGGPIYLPKVSPWNDKKLFFFFNYEGTRASRPNGGAFYDVANPALLTGDFSSALRFNADGSPVLLKGTNFNIGTIFQPGTITRDNAGNITGGIPFQNNVVPQNMWSGNAQAFIKVIQRAYRGGTNLPITPGTPDKVRVPFQDNYKFTKNQKALRVDYNLNAKTNLFFRWVDDAQQESQGLGIFSGNSFPVFPEYRKKPGASWSWNMVNIIAPTLTNEAIFTYNHLTQVVNVIDIQPNQYQESALGFTFQDPFPTSNTLSRLPSFNSGGYATVSPFPPNWVSEGKTFAFTDNVTKVAGRHAFKFGTYINKNINGQQPAWTDAPNFNFSPGLLNANDTNNGLANLLLGNYTTLSQSNGRFYGSFRFWQFELFGQDSVRVNRKLTLELGLRWSYLGPTGTYGPYLQYYFDPTLFNPANAVSIVTASGARRGSIVPNSGDLANGMVQEGKGIPFGFAKHHWNNYGPRFGFAYDPGGDGKTAIRGGFGIFYERVRQNANSFDGLGNPPLLYTPTIYSGNVDQVSPALVSSGVRFTSSVRAFSKEGPVPTTYSWSIGVQRQLPAQIALDVSYVGNVARHLQYVYDLNSLPLATTTSTAILTNANGVQDAIRPFRGYNSINYTDYGANSSYNGLQTRVSRRFSRSFTMNAEYTWSKAMDIVDNDTATIDFWQNRQFNWGPAGFDRKHVFNVDYVYTLPTPRGNGAVRKILGGWEVSGITRFWSGFPLNVNMSSGGNQGTLSGTVRADYLGGSTSGNGTRLQWFNPFVFARPADGTTGNVGRGIIRGPGINNWDFSLFKNTNITEKVRTQLRVETFNIFNHTQWAGVSTNVSAANPGAPVTAATVGTAGQITSTRDPRQIQLALKLYF